MGPLPAEVQASDAAAAEAGGGAADDVVQGCALARVGIFFDGTANFRGNVGQPEAAWHTNVDLLQRTYDEQLDDDVEVTFPNGHTQIAKVWSVYLPGIGIEHPLPDGDGTGAVNNAGQGLGTGATGVDARAQEAITQLNADLATNAGGTRFCDVWIDAFGFSRGAAAARDFANHVRDGDIQGAGARVRTKFMGLFDTVSSIARPGEMDGTWWVDLRTPGRAETIVHITADDEFRRNFPLTRSGGRHIPMAGSHGDIGGGWSPSDPGAEFEYQMLIPRQGLYERITSDWGVTLDGPVTPDGASLTSRSDVVTAGMGMAAQITFHRFAWRAVHGLQFVSMRLMHHWAQAAGVPFADLESTVDNISIALDARLQGYFERLLADPGSVTEAEHTAIRRTYAHFSPNGRMALGVIPINHPEWDGQRRSITM